MRTLALVSAAGRPDRDRTPGRLAATLAVLAGLGPVDLVVLHDEAAGTDERRSWSAGTGIRPDHVERRLEVATRRLPAGGSVREVHLGRSKALEVAARGAAWFGLVDAFVLAAPPPDLVWCADLAAATRAGWLRRAVPAAVDLDRFEDLSSARARRSARRTASTAHLVTTDSPERRTMLGLPGTVVVAEASDDELAARIEPVVEQAAAYRPART